MKFRWAAVAAIVGFSSGAGVACEADHQAMQKTSLLPAVHSIANDKDALSLTSAQQRTAWESISRHGTIQFAASSFTASMTPASRSNRKLHTRKDGAGNCSTASPSFPAFNR